MDSVSDKKPMLGLCNNTERYLQCLTEFDRGLKWLPDYKIWINTHLGKQVLDAMSLADSNRQLRILSIGSGEGEVELNLLSRLLTKYPHIHNTVVEPSEAQVEIYRQRLRDAAPSPGEVQYNWHVQTLGEYRQSYQQTDEPQFDFISALYCLYYEADMDESLEFLYKLLKPGGVLLAGMETEHCDVIKIEERYQFAQDDDGNSFFSTQDIRSFLKKRSIPYSICSQPEDQRDFDITACFQDDSEQGSLLVDFLSNVLNFRQVAPPNVLKEFMDYVQELCTSRNDRMYLFYDSEYILALK